MDITAVAANLREKAAIARSLGRGEDAAEAYLKSADVVEQAWHDHAHDGE